MTNTMTAMTDLGPTPGAAATPRSTPEAAQVLGRLLGERHSCRGYRSTPVDDAVIEEILRLAQRTASWCNAQPWQVLITRGAGTERLREAFFRQATQNPVATDLPFPEDYVGVYKDRRRGCATALYSSVGVAMGDREGSARQTSENFRFFGAPHLAVVTTDRKLGVYGAVDCGAYVSTFLLAAASLGVAAIPQAAIATQSPFLHKALDIPEDRLVVCGISFGYEDTGHPANAFRTSRAPISDVVRWVSQ